MREGWTDMYPDKDDIEGWGGNIGDGGTEFIEAWGGLKAPKISS